MTPPVRPKMVAAPVESPSGLSKGASESAVQSTPTRRSRRPNSRTVSTASTSGAASAASSGATGASGTRPASLVPAPWVAPTTVESSGTSHSYFFATQGMMDTTNRRRPASAASAASVFLTTAPIIWCGDLALESWAVNCG